MLWAALCPVSQLLQYEVDSIWQWGSASSSLSHKLGCAFTVCSINLDKEPQGTLLYKNGNRGNQQHSTTLSCAAATDSSILVFVYNKICIIIYIIFKIFIKYLVIYIYLHKRNEECTAAELSMTQNHLTCCKLCDMQHAVQTLPSIMLTLRACTSQSAECLVSLCHCKDSRHTVQ